MSTTSKASSEEGDVELLSDNDQDMDLAVDQSNVTTRTRGSLSPPPTVTTPPASLSASVVGYMGSLFSSGTPLPPQGGAVSPSSMTSSEASDRVAEVQDGTPRPETVIYDDEVDHPAQAGPAPLAREVGQGPAPLVRPTSAARLATAPLAREVGPGPAPLVLPTSAEKLAAATLRHNFCGSDSDDSDDSDDTPLGDLLRQARRGQLPDEEVPLDHAIARDDDMPAEPGPAPQASDDQLIRAGDIVALLVDMGVITTADGGLDNSEIGRLIQQPPSHFVRSLVAEQRNGSGDGNGSTTVHRQVLLQPSDQGQPSATDRDEDRAPVHSGRDSPTSSVGSVSPPPGPFTGTMEEVPNPSGGPAMFRRTVFDCTHNDRRMNEVIVHPLQTTVTVTEGGEVVLRQEKDSANVTRTVSGLPTDAELRNKAHYGGDIDESNADARARHEDIDRIFAELQYERDNPPPAQHYENGCATKTVPMRVHKPAPNGKNGKTPAEPVDGRDRNASTMPIRCHDDDLQRKRDVTNTSVRVTGKPTQLPVEELSKIHHDRPIRTPTFEHEITVWRSVESWAVFKLPGICGFPGCSWQCRATEDQTSGIGGSPDLEWSTSGCRKFCSRTCRDRFDDLENAELEGRPYPPPFSWGFVRGDTHQCPTTRTRPISILAAGMQSPARMKVPAPLAHASARRGNKFNSMSRTSRHGGIMQHEERNNLTGIFGPAISRDENDKAMFVDDKLLDRFAPAQTMMARGAHSTTTYESWAAPTGRPGPVPLTPAPERESSSQPAPLTGGDSTVGWKRAGPSHDKAGRHSLLPTADPKKLRNARPKDRAYAEAARPSKTPVLPMSPFCVQPGCQNRCVYDTSIGAHGGRLMRYCAMHQYLEDPVATKPSSADTQRAHATDPQMMLRGHYGIVGGLPYVPGPAYTDFQQQRHGAIIVPVDATYTDADVFRATGILTAEQTRTHKDIVRVAIFAASDRGWNGDGTPDTLAPGSDADQSLQDIYVTRVLQQAQDASDARRLTVLGIQPDGTSEALRSGLRGGAAGSHAVADAWNGQPPAGPSDQPPPSAGTAASSSFSAKLVGELSKLEEFSGLETDWLAFKRSVQRVAAVNDLEGVLEHDYVQSANFVYRDNKLMYFLLERAVAGNVTAYEHFNTAAQYDGNGAYFALHNAYTMGAAAQGALLLQHLTLFRLRSGELLGSFCARLKKVFSDLSGLEGENAMSFNNTQQLAYLMTAIRHEPDLKEVFSYLQGEQTRGALTFELAIKTLIDRCDAARADQALNDAAGGRRMAMVSGHFTGFPPYEEDTGVEGNNGSTGTALVTTMNKQHTPGKRNHEGTPCVVSKCSAISMMPICQLHFAEMVCGKTKSLTLRNNWGQVTFDSDTRSPKFPASMPDDQKRRQKYSKDSGVSTRKQRRGGGAPDPRK